jgi:hypothetical protein
MTSISPLEIMKDSKRFVSEPNLFARRKLIYERKPTFPFVESNRCLSYRKLQQNGHTSLSSSTISVSLDSGMEFYGSGSSIIGKASIGEDWQLCLWLTLVLIVSSFSGVLLPDP